jgi:transposase
MTDKISTLFVGVDTHKETHTLAGANVACEKLCELTFENSHAGFQEALEKILRTSRDNSLKPLVGLEDSGGNGSSFARFLCGRSIPVKTVNPVLVKRNGRYQTHPEKSDSQDALEIAIVSVQRTDKLPDFTLTENAEFAKSVNVLVDEREDLVCGQTRVKNKLHWALYGSWGLSYRTIYQKNVFGKRSLDFWLKYPSIADFKRTTRPMIDKPEWLVETETNDLPIVSETEKRHIRRLVGKLQMIISQLEEIDGELEGLASDNYSYLPTCPGCGALTASKLIAYVKDIDKFGSEKKLAKYAGIAPRKNESGKIRRNISSARGHSGLRRAFKTIALAQIGRRGNRKGKEYFEKKIKEGKSKRQALKCLMRQNVKIIFSMMKGKREYYE